MSAADSSSRKPMTLARYVRKRNGVPLGAAGSLTNMLSRSLGAPGFRRFWQYWNPVWGYCLGRYVHQPLSRWLPSAVAVVMTFAVSGFLHDLAVMIVKFRGIFFFTPWFAVMGMLVVLTSAFGVRFDGLPWWGRATMNL
ncbi:MAG: hypothetical protein KDI36_05645, partial [Pseudomonadales bacterium]|nr:hypothetical protein [Pseudomonadales bacterium]